MLLSGEERYENKIDALLKLGYTLSYRLDGMTMATGYKDLLGLDYLDCSSCDVAVWTHPLHDSKQQEVKEKLSRYRKIVSLIRAAKNFSAASIGQGYNYEKPGEYLAIAFVESGRTKGEIEHGICILKDCKLFLLH